MITFPLIVVNPWIGSDATAMLEYTPEIDAVRSIGVAVFCGTVTLLPETTGGPGGLTVMLTVAGAEVPPGPVAV